MVRAKVRFGLLIGAIALLVFLILFQQALRDGLITSFVGAIEHQDAPVLVYSTDARRNLQSSTIPPELEAQVRAVDGVQAVGRIGQGTYSVTADGTIKAAAIIGYEKRSLGAPESLVAGRYPTADGEGVANETDASEGFDLGDVVRVEPGGYRIRIVGQSRDTNLQATPTDLRPLRHVGGGGAGRQSRRAAAAPERARCGTGAGGYAGRASAADRRGEHTTSDNVSRTGPSPIIDAFTPTNGRRDNGVPWGSARSRRRG